MVTLDVIPGELQAIACEAKKFLILDKIIIWKRLRVLKI